MDWAVSERNKNSFLFCRLAQYYKPAPASIVELTDSLLVALTVLYPAFLTNISAQVVFGCQLEIERGGHI